MLHYLIVFFNFNRNLKEFTQEINKDLKKAGFLIHLIIYKIVIENFV